LFVVSDYCMESFMTCLIEDWRDFTWTITLANVTFFINQHFHLLRIFEQRHVFKLIFNNSINVLDSQPLNWMVHVMNVRLELQQMETTTSRSSNSCHKNYHYLNLFSMKLQLASYIYILTYWNFSKVFYIRTFSHMIFSPRCDL